MIIEDFILSLYTKEQKDRIQNKLNLYGSNHHIDLVTFLSIRLLVCVITFFMFLFVSESLVLSFILVALSYVLFEIVLVDKGLKQRRQILEKDAIFFFEILALTISSGKTLKKSLELTTEKMDNTLSYEFKKALEEMKQGKTFSEAVNDMKKYIPSETVNSVLVSLKESYELGTPILDTIYTVIDYLKEKRVLLVKGTINKMPTLVSVVSVLIFIPLVLLLILGPVLLMLM